MAARRTTVYFTPALYSALRIKAASTKGGFSELVNEAVQLSLRENASEDSIDEEALRIRAKEPSLAFSEVRKKTAGRAKIE